MDKPDPTPAENLISLARSIERLAYDHQIKTDQIAPPVVEVVTDMVDGEPVKRRKVIDPGGRRTKQVMHAPLITRLRRAIYESTSAGGEAGVTESRARSVMNPAAMEKLNELRRVIGLAWLTLIPDLDALPRTWSEEEALQKWADLFIPQASLGRIDPEVIASAAQVFSGWRSAIERMFTPQRVISSQWACPACGKRWAIVDGERRHAIVISVANDVERSVAVCRAEGCGHIWKGTEELHQLARDQRERVALLGQFGEDDSDTPENETAISSVEDVLH